MQSGLVSVMMPAYNAEQYIAQAIESLLVQEYPNWELIIVDDGSTDRTAEMASRFCDPRIKLFHQANAGEAAARNTALKRMKGEFVAFLDADDLYLSNHLAATVKYLQAHPDHGGVYTDGFHCDQDGTRLKSLSSRRWGPFEGDVFDEVVRGPNVFGPPVSVVLRSNPISQHNLQFDEDITIGPDWLFFSQYADVAQFGYVAQSTCLYRVHHTNITARIGLHRRSLELAKCRLRMMDMENFKTCSLRTHVFVFYDLLVNLLNGFPDQQSELLLRPEFCDLAPEFQARILRLMASKAVINGTESQYIEAWLRRSRELDPTDRRVAVLSAVYRANPWFCKLLLRARSIGQTDPSNAPPFADLGKAYS